MKTDEQLTVILPSYVYRNYGNQTLLSGRIDNVQQNNTSTRLLVQLYLNLILVLNRVTKYSYNVVETFYKADYLKLKRRVGEIVHY